MRKKLLMADLILLTLIIATFTSFASSNELKSQVTYSNFVSTIQQDANPLDLGICHWLRTSIQNYRNAASQWRDKVNFRPNDPAWVKVCNYIANYYDHKADALQSYYNYLQSHNLCD
jgi:hypothetical protein